MRKWGGNQFLAFAEVNVCPCWDPVLFPWAPGLPAACVSVCSQHWTCALPAVTGEDTCLCCRESSWGCGCRDPWGLWAAGSPSDLGTCLLCMLPECCLYNQGFTFSPTGSMFAFMASLSCLWFLFVLNLSLSKFLKFKRKKHAHFWRRNNWFFSSLKLCRWR